MAGQQFTGSDPFGPPGPGRAVLAPGVQPVTDPLEGTGVAGDDDPAAVCERQQRERAGDAVGHAQVRVTAGERPGWRCGGNVDGPPAWRGQPGRVGGRQWFGEPDKVGQDLAELLAVGVAGRQVGTEAGQTSDQVELGAFRSPSRLDPCVGRREPPLDQPFDGGVQLLDRAEVAAGWGCRCQRERKRGGTEPQAGARPSGKVFPGGGRQPGCDRGPTASVGAGAHAMENRDAGRALGQRLALPAWAARAPVAAWLGRWRRQRVGQPRRDGGRAGLPVDDHGHGPSAPAGSRWVCWSVLCQASATARASRWQVRSADESMP